ncbi:MAG: baseplate J/gp47 family protein [Treponema sp.]|nr:baseplate J/gp47 family protein [Treponema sp.]
MVEIRRYEDIMQQATANTIALQDKITDFNDGSIAHTLLDSVSRIAERQYVAIRQGYNENLALVPYSIYKFKRKQGTKAAGTAVFSRAKELPVRSIITSGSRSGGAGKEYITTETGYIEAGQKHSNPIKILAAEIGASYNLPSGVIDTIITALPSDVIEVTNDIAITGGTDIETDTELHERFKIFQNGLSGTNIYAIIDAALGLDCVRSVSAKNHKPPLKNIYNMSVYVDDGSGSASEETIAAVMLAIEGDGTALNQGHLAPGVNVRVLPPQTVPVNFDVVVDVYKVDIIGAEEEVKKVITGYVNSLKIGKSFIKSDIIARIRSLPFTRDVNVNSPSENIDIGSDQILRFGSAKIEIRETANG